MSLEQKLHEELMRFKSINKYGKKMIMEQDAPADLPPAPDANPTDLPPADAEAPAADVTAPLPDAPVAPEMDSTEEIDITDLVNMT